MNSIFQLMKGSYQEAEFKRSKRGMFLQNLPKFSAVPVSNLATNISFSPLVTTPMNLEFETTLDNVPTGFIKSMDDDLLQFIKHCREDSCLLGNKLWDEDLIYHIAIELWCFQLKKNIIFNTANVIEGCRVIFATSTDWEYSPHVETQRSYTRNKHAMRNIENHIYLPLAACGVLQSRA